MDLYYYVDKNNQQQGPVNANDLPKYGVTKDTLIWKQGMSDWLAAGSIPELSDIFPPIIAQTDPVVSTPPVSSSSSASPTPQKPDNYLVWSILTTIFCCMPAGVVAIVYSAKVDSLWNKNEYKGAREAAKTAKTWCWVSFGVAIGLWLIFILLNICLGLACMPYMN